MHTYIFVGSLCFSQLLLGVAKLSSDLHDDLQSEAGLMNPNSLSPSPIKIFKCVCLFVYLCAAEVG